MLDTNRFHQYFLIIVKAASGTGTLQIFPEESIIVNLAVTMTLWVKRLKFFFALSRTPHGALDMAMPAFAALLWLGHFPSPKIVILGMVTAFAGYTAVYALNDILDYRVDKLRIEQGLLSPSLTDLDSIFVRHPLAYGYLSYNQALLWTVAWAVVAFIGACALDLRCALIFLGGCALEAAYCLLWQRTCLKVFISGAVKTSGALAAVFAVDPNPDLLPLLLLFFCFFCWEIGGQNIPNDWADVEEDRVLGATTIPLRFASPLASGLIISSLVFTIAINSVILGSLHVNGRFLGVAASLVTGIYLLLIPAFRLYRTNKRTQALALFNRASYYPAALLAVIIFTIML